MKKLSFFDKILYVINSLLALLLLCSYLLPYISPKTFPLFAVLSLFVPALMIINLVFVVYWIATLKKQFLLSTFILLLGLFFSTPFYKISDKNSAFSNDLKVMSFNVKTYDLFSNKNESKNGFDFIADKEPDIICFQEHYKGKKTNLNFKYKYIEIRKHSFGLAIFSKYKIINKGSLNLKNTANNIIYADIVKNSDTIRIYNFHLQSLQIHPNEENFGEENSEKLLATLKNRFKKQASQVEKFLAHEKQWKGKKIICGDFNNTAYSWAYKQVSRDKKDAFIEAGKGFGKTFNYWFPMRIDFILADNTSTINRFNTFNNVKYSDHYPITSYINWK